MIEFLGYQEILSNFRFRDRAAITIPKSVRENAYTLAVDIVINQVAREPYKNYKSTPAHSFYGYAVLVMQDSADIQIKIEQPRQRLYYGRISEAFTNSYSLYLFSLLRSVLKYTLVKLDRIGAAVGVEDGTYTFFCPSPPPFVELPLRELYIETANGTSFSLEVSYMKSEVNEYEECTYDGKSGQTDGDKDSGLPPAGVQPNTSPNPDNPFEGSFPPSTSGQLGDFLNGKFGSLDDSDPDNSAPEPVAYSLTAEADFQNGDGTCTNNAPWSKTIRVASDQSPYRVVYTLLNGSCGGLYGARVFGADNFEVPIGGCLNGASCSMVGRGAVTVSIIPVYS